MHETLFHRELLDAFRSAGWWAAKWPDTVASAMQMAKTGKMRFSLPKPCDLVLCDPSGIFGAIEAKLIRSPRMKIETRWERQIEQLEEFKNRNAWAWFAINFRFVREKTGAVNRAFLVQPDILKILSHRTWIPRGTIDLEHVASASVELSRTTGGWKIPI